MVNQKPNHTANDNVPAMLAARVKQSLSVDTPLRSETTADMGETISSPTPESQSSQSSEFTGSLKITLGCWVTALILMLGAFLLSAGTGPKALTSIALLWTGLWASYVSADHGKWRLSEISIVTALGGLMGAVITAANYFNMGLTLSDGLLLMSIVPLILGYLMKSRISALASICASLIWAMLSFSGLAEVSNFVMLLPAVFAAQVFVGTKIRSGMVITLAVLTAYYWVANFVFLHWSAGDLPLTFGAAALFIMGAAHHRAGKAAEDKELTGSSIHIYAGWIAALIGAIGFQYFWLTPDAMQSETASLTALGLNLWKGIVLASLVIILCSAVVRYKHSQLSFAGIVLVTIASAFLPMMLWFPSWPDILAAAIPGVSLIPTIGVLIGAAITAAAIGMMLNGARRHSPIMMGLGLAVLFTEAALLFRPELVTLENAVIFTAGLLACLGVGATIAGLSLSHQGSAPRLKHS